MRIINNTKEIQELTGSFYNSAQFDRIKTDIDLETEAIISLIGQSVYDKAEADYVEPDEATPSPDQPELVQHIQLPIAMMATLRYYQSNMVTHGDNGRKVKINSESEKMAWEWMIDADDQAQLRKVQAATDRLINYLEKTPVEEWISSDARKASRELFINSTELFHQVFPIDNSPRFFYTVTPFLRSIQLTQIRPAMGDDYDTLIQEWIDGSVSAANKPIIELIQQSMPLLTMAMATRRLSIQVLPESVVQIFRSQYQSLKASQPVLEDTIRRFRLEVLEEGLDALDKARQLRTGDTTEITLLPKNDQCNKYMRT